MSRRPSTAPRAKPKPGPKSALPGSRLLDRLDQVRVLAHPLRLRLLELFAEAPRTTKQAADRLELPATRLYHHVAALERVGLVRVRETRPNRGTIEKHYEAVARGFETDPTVLARGAGRGTKVAATRLANESVAALAMRIVDGAGEGLMASLDAWTREGLGPEDARRPLALQAVLIAKPERIVAMREDVVALLERWRTEDDGKDEEGATLRAVLTIVFSPDAKGLEEKGTKKTRTSGSGGRKPGGGT